MADNLGNDVSSVYDESLCNYNMVVFQKGKPPLDSELNVVQHLQEVINRRQLAFLPSGWLTLYPFYTDGFLKNSFYTQNPANPKPEYVLVNGYIIHVTNTGTKTDNLNVINLGDPPISGNKVIGVFLEVWKALIDPDANENKPDPETVIDAFNAVFMANQNLGWICGENGLVLVTENGGTTWITKETHTNQTLNDIFFATSNIGWVVGSAGTILRSSSQGEKWTRLDSPCREDLKSISAVSSLIAYIAGDNGVILKTTNGITWQRLNSGTTTNLRKIHFRDSNVGWVVGENGLIMRTTNGGLTWTRVTSNTTENLNSIFFYGLNYGFAAGENGTILKSTDGGITWANISGNIWDESLTCYKTITKNLKNVYMVPGLDVQVIDEEVSSQFNGTNKSCTVAHTPITIGDGRGTVTNTPSYVKVTVNGTEVVVDGLNGETGTVTLAVAPRIHDTVKVSYWYRGSCEVFSGEAWIAGEGGTILKTEDLGAMWVEQDSGTFYDLNGIFFTNIKNGWAVGAQSVIRNTQNGGLTWTKQQSQSIARKVPRIYREGNVRTLDFLVDRSIHPDTKVETTKRVQIQYRIRVVSGVDPENYPEAGLSQYIMAEGPGKTGGSAYENMGPINGDYGLWRARCPDTVDGYCYAIPMFFVNRRNSGTYNPSTNANGSHIRNSEFIRPDLLTATQVTDNDILDVRRKVIIPSLSELLTQSLMALTVNGLKTNFQRATIGGDRYGTEILTTDRIKGSDSDGGQLIQGDLVDAVQGNIASRTAIIERSVTVSASTTLPTEYDFGIINGIYHPNPAFYTAVYDSPGSIYDKRAVPGYFEGMGTNRLKFVFRSYANTKNNDLNLNGYIFTLCYLSASSYGLSHIPSTPYLVKNKNQSGDAIYYQGVLSTSDYKLLESWDSGITGYRNYVLVYTARDASDTLQRNRGSTVELHYFKKIDVTDTSLTILNTIRPYADDSGYVIYAISKVKNVTSGFSHKIRDIILEGGNITIEVVSGYEFVAGTVVEIIACVCSKSDRTGSRNGASVNFDPGVRGINNFCESRFEQDIEVSFGVATLTIPDGILLGIATAETADGLAQPIGWVNSGSKKVMRPIAVSGFGTSTVRIEIGGGISSVSIQALIKRTALEYSSDNDALLISYSYVPYQTCSLPDVITVEIAEILDSICIANQGRGGGNLSHPSPVEHIPISSTDAAIEGLISDFLFLDFSNFCVDDGLVRMPRHISADIRELTLSQPLTDSAKRTYYYVCSREFEFATEGLRIPVPRIIYLPVIARIKESSSEVLMRGEYVLVIFSRTLNTEKENTVGYKKDGNDIIAIYRLPNRPISRM